MILLLLGIHNAIAKDIPTIPNMLYAAEIKYELPKGLLKAIAQVESSGNKNAFNPDDAPKREKERGIKTKSWGLLQLQCESAKTVGFNGKCKELMNPEVNIEYGAKYLRYLLEENDDVALSLVAWNAGPNSGVVERGRYTQYVGKILNAWINIKKD